ncbi:MAG: hypothetical protein M1834_000691 [Cirrosporium novae-zelandiae]|nr:MAG: hypothetical protein M1834_000691 [Cirrosporium novae-zelandiae]
MPVCSFLLFAQDPSAKYLAVDGNDGRRRPGVQSRHHRAQSQPIISGTGPKNVVGGPLAEEDISGLKSSPSLSSSSSSKRNPTTVPARRHTSHLSLSSSVRRPRDQNQDAATPGPSSQSHRESKPATTTTIKENTQNETTDNNKISPGHLRHRSTGGKKKVEGSRETGR